jgi:hypothetical protein
MGKPSNEMGNSPFASPLFTPLGTPNEFSNNVHDYEQLGIKDNFGN